MQFSSFDKTVLVIGGAGYIGSVLVRRLLERGYKVKVLDVLLYNNVLSLNELKTNPGYSFIKGDFCDKKTLNKTLDGVTDLVLLAALVGDPICKKYPNEANRVNLNGSIQLLDSLNGRGIDRFVFLSTCSNYGLRPDETPAVEETELNPKSLYAETKVAVERYILENYDNFDFCPVILRSATAFGLSPRMRFDLTISEFTRELVLGRELLVYDENTWRPYCHVDDISGAIIKVIEADWLSVRGEIFNVGSNTENYTKKDIVNIICEKVKNCRINYKQGGFDPRNYRVSFDKITSVLGFANKYNVPGAVEKLIEAIKNGRFEDVDNNKSFYGNYVLPVE